MGKETLSREAFREVRDTVRARGGPATKLAEQRSEAGEKLNPLVDPSSFGVIRRSITRMDKDGSKFVSTMGLALLVENRFDTTASMGNNVDLVFGALPRLYDLLASGSQAVLGRYDTQIIMSNFNDMLERHPLCRSMAEMGVKIAEQLTMLVPHRAGGDDPEDPELGLFGAAYLTAASAKEFGLKTYDFTITDAPGRGYIDPSVLRGVYGDEVFEKVKENGGQVNQRDLPKTKDLVDELSRTAHAFLLQVGERGNTSAFWKQAYGANRVVVLPRTELLPEVQAAIIGLTEGVVDLQGLPDFLEKEAEKLSRKDAESIARAVSRIPIGAQTALPNFNKVFPKGALFVKKGDVFPIGFDGVKDDSLAEEPPKKKKDGKVWL